MQVLHAIRSFFYIFNQFLPKKSFTIKAKTKRTSFENKTKDFRHRPEPQMELNQKWLKKKSIANAQINKKIE